MDKLEFCSILQVALFNFEGATEQEIKELNPDFTERQLKTGIHLTKTLQEIK